VLQSYIFIQEFKSFLHRRKKLLILTPVLMVLLSYGALFLIEPKYKSSTTILVQHKETLNPLLDNDVTDKEASQNRFKSFNEVIYSRSTIEMLIDSLNIGANLKDPANMQDLVNNVQKNIQTSIKASDSFTITYQSTDPIKAKKGVNLLSERFIKMRQKLENKSNKQTVEFYEKKVTELERAVNQRKDKVLDRTRANVNKAPLSNVNLQNRISKVESDIKDLSLQMNEYQNRLRILKSITNSGSSNLNMDLILEMDVKDLPYGDDLQKLVTEYEGYKSQYTTEYPQMKRVKSQIIGILGKMPTALENEITIMRNKKEELETHYQDLLGQLKESYAAETNSDQDKSDYGIFKNMYGDMKVKLEQARINYELGLKSNNQFVVIDPAIVPLKPSQPNKIYVLVGGFIAGIILGIIAAATAELFDTTVRSPKELEPFEKPIIAYISEG